MSEQKVWMLLSLAAIILPLLASRVEGEGVVADPVPDRAERLRRFEARNNELEVQQLAHQLMKAIDPDAPGVKEGFSRLYRDGRYSEALESYQDYVLTKLEDPEQYGIPSMCIEPQDPGGGNPLGASVCSPTTDQLMRNTVTVRDLEVEIGQPGAVNWTFIPPGWESKPLAPGELGSPDNHTGDTPMLPRVESWQKAPADFARHFRHPFPFGALLASYAQTGDKSYLDKWAAYIDDWCMNQKSDSDQSPYAIQLYLPQQIAVADWFIGNMAYLARAQPNFARDLPPTTLARIVLRYIPESAAASIRQLRFSELNWRYLISRRLVTTGLLFPELRISPMMIEEGRRGMEMSAVVHAMPDGSEYEINPNYWGTYVDWGQPLFQLAYDEAAPGLDHAWLDEQGEHALACGRAILAMLMPNGRWPIIGPIDLRPMHGDYDQPGMWNILPGFLESQDNARRLNLTFGENSPAYGRAGDDGKSEPSYTSESLPYIGLYFLRGGWSPDDPFAFMKSSDHVIGHLSSPQKWQNDNVASLYAFGEELLFVHHETPVTVDGNQQNTCYGLPYSGHIGYMLPKKVHPKPADVRWHTSDAFDYAEGIYDRPYGNPGEHVSAHLLGKQPEKPITGVTHSRQIFFTKSLGAWVIVDRMDSKDEHEYSQLWMLHSPEPSDYGDIHGFAPDQIHVDTSRNLLRTSHPAGPNVSLYQMATSPLSMETIIAPVSNVKAQSWTTEGRDSRYLETGSYLLSFTISKLRTSWSGKGNQALVSLIIPRQDDQDAVASIKKVEDEETLGFDLAMKDGSNLFFRLAPDYGASLKTGDLSIDGEALLVVENKDNAKSGIILGSKQVSVGDRTVDTRSPDAEFILGSDGQLDAKPIYKPIDPVGILPDVNVFSDSLEVRLSTATSGTTIHYTLDGSNPTPASPVYTKPILLKESATVRARAFREGVDRVPPTYNGTDCTVASLAVFTKQQPRKAQSPAGTSENGLDFQYYEGEWQDLLLQLDTLNPVRTGHVKMLLDVSAAQRDRYFSFRYTGWFEAPETGVYTFYSPEPVFTSDLVHLEPGYDLGVKVDGMKWYPATRQHAFGSWSIALEKGKHPIDITYADFRGGKEDMYFPNKHYGCVWAGDKPKFELSGPGMDRQEIRSRMLWRRK